MNHLRLIASCILLLQSVSFLFAQNDLQNGFIVKAEGDTVSGYINVNSNIKNSQYCEFTSNQNEPISKYTPKDIKAFVIGGNKIFLSKTIENQDTIPTQAFLELLVDGIVDLYKMEEGKGIRYFIEKENEVHELSNDEILQNNNEVRYVRDSKKYIGVLNYLFRDSETAREQIAQTQLAVKPLAKLTENYHNSVCDSYDCISYVKNSGAEVKVMPFVGYTFNYFTKRSTLSSLKDNSASFGLRVSVAPKVWIDRWSLYTGLFIQQQTYEGMLQYSEKSEFTGFEDYNIDFSTIKIPVGGRYHFNNKKISPYINAGITTHFVIGGNQSEDGIREFLIGSEVAPGLRFSLSRNQYLYTEIIYNISTPAVGTGDKLDNIQFQSIGLNLGLEVF